MTPENTLHIKNMVCNRCILVVGQLLERAGLVPLGVELGRVVLREAPDRAQRETLRALLESYGFELLDDKRLRLVEQIRTAVIELVHYTDADPKVNLSDYLRERCHRDYSFLSKLFSEICGQSIEKYYLAQRIERVKELLADGEMTVGEIADRMRYSSTAHLSAQFRSQTGLSPSEFRRLNGRGLKPLDEV